jgi:hypothetical protein
MQQNAFLLRFHRFLRGWPAQSGKAAGNELSRVPEAARWGRAGDSLVGRRGSGWRDRGARHLSSGDNDARIEANGYFKIGKLKLGGGWIGRRVESEGPVARNVHSDLAYVGAQYKQGV